MVSKAFLPFLLCFSSWVTLGFSQDLSDHKDGEGGVDSSPCIHKLMPCQPFFRSTSSSPLPPPPATCCEPLKEIMEVNSTCLCEIFKNGSDILKNFNLTHEDALELPMACGANTNISLCFDNASPMKKRTGRTWISRLGGSSFIILIMDLTLAPILIIRNRLDQMAD